MSITNIIVSEETFDPAAALERFRKANKDAGAITSFVGQVRDRASKTGALVTTLTLEHYPGFTEKAVASIVEEARARWPVSGVCIIHRVGALAPGDAIVFIACASAHRRAAFEAADFLMDYLKSEAPFWKKEQTEAGEAWIEPRPNDYQDKNRWAK